METIIKIAHKFEIVGKIGTCPCGEMREYIEGETPKDNSYRVIRAGDPKYHLPQSASADTNSSKSDTSTPLVVTQEAKSVTNPGQTDSKDDQNVEKKTRHVKSWDYYESIKDELISDYRSLTIRVFLKKHGIPTHIWKELRERWHVSGNPRGAARRKLLREVPPDAEAHRELVFPLPPFPCFNENWEPEIKVAWLMAYGRIKEGSR